MRAAQRGTKPEGRVPFATKHGKGPVVEAVLADVGLRVVEVPIDTDRFGTFTRVVPRPGDQLETARAKCRAAFEAEPDATWVLASEGAFGPWPALPLVCRGVEVLMLRSRAGVEIIGRDATLETSFGQETIQTLEGARVFATRVGFPAQAVFVAAPGREGGALTDATSVDEEGALLSAVERRLRKHGSVRLEADVRAHRSPLRRASIARAAESLARRLRTPCPRCGHPGFGAVGLEGRAPCSACAAPTEVPSDERMRCPTCEWEDRRPREVVVGPERCPMCNP